MGEYIHYAESMTQARKRHSPKNREAKIKKEETKDDRSCNLSSPLAQKSPEEKMPDKKNHGSKFQLFLCNWKLRRKFKYPTQTPEGACSLLPSPLKSTIQL